MNQASLCRLLRFAVLPLAIIAIITTIAIDMRLMNAVFQKNNNENSLDLAPSFELARNQSNGFFDDVSNDDWKRLQKITYESWPNHFSDDLKKYVSTLKREGIDRVSPNNWNRDGSNWWNAENFQEEFHCQYAQRVPSDSNGDGPKWVCDPHRIAKQKSCLIYSVGSNGNVMFEKGIKEQVSVDCEIHTFDPTTYNRRNGDFAEALKGYSTFHNWGLDSQTDERRKMKTLQQTVKDLGHEGRQIDIFKIDCEWCEWFTYKQWIDEANSFSLKQILVETHNAPLPEAKNFFYDLHDAGYVIFSKEANFQNGGGGVEFAFIKLSTEFFFNNSLYKNL